MEITSFSDCFENLRLVPWTALVRSSTVVSSNEDCGEKELHIIADCVSSILNDKVVAGLLG